MQKIAESTTATLKNPSHTNGKRPKIKILDKYQAITQVSPYTSSKIIGEYFGTDSVWIDYVKDVSDGFYVQKPEKSVSSTYTTWHEATVVERFLYECPLAFALASNEMFGWPLRVEQYDDNINHSMLRHAWTVTPMDEPFDILGRRYNQLYPETQKDRRTAHVIEINQNDEKAQGTPRKDIDEAKFLIAENLLQYRITTSNFKSKNYLAKPKDANDTPVRIGDIVSVECQRNTHMRIVEISSQNNLYLRDYYGPTNIRETTTLLSSTACKIIGLSARERLGREERQEA